MKRNSLILLTLLLSVGSLSAQVPTLQWQKALGGTAEDMAMTVLQTTDGGYITAGYTLSTDGNVTGNHGLQDMWVVKLNASGTVAWQKALGGSEEDVANSIVQTADGGYVIAGYSLSPDGDVTGNHGDYDMWIVKLSATGALVWQKSYGGTDADVAYSIAKTADNGFIVGGFTASYDGNVTVNHGGGDAWVVKLTATGDLQWQKTLGGTLSESAKSISQTADGGYIMAGKTYSNDLDVSGNHGNYDYWVVKLDSAGAIQWQKTLGGTNEDEANAVITTSDGGYIVAGIVYNDTTASNGNITNPRGEHDCWVVKLSSTGVLQWQKALGGTNADRAYSVVPTADGGLVVAGSCQSFNGDITANNDNGGVWLVKLNASGVLQWQKPFGGSGYDSAYCLTGTSDGGFAVAGFTYSNDGDITGNHGDSDYWILKLSAENLATDTFTTMPVRVYPNPVAAVLQIDALSDVITAVKITDLTGKTVLHQTSCNGTLVVDFLSKGIYVLEIVTETATSVHKFVKL